MFIIWGGAFEVALVNEIQRKETWARIGKRGSFAVVDIGCLYKQSKRIIFGPKYEVPCIFSQRRQDIIWCQHVKSIKS